MVWCAVVWFGVHQTRLPATDPSSESSSSPTRYGMAEMEQGFCSRLTERGHRAVDWIDVGEVFTDMV
jgi:hypothetical protein